MHQLNNRKNKELKKNRLKNKKVRRYSRQIFLSLRQQSSLHLFTFLIFCYFCSTVTVYGLLMTVQITIYRRKKNNLFSEFLPLLSVSNTRKAKFKTTPKCLIYLVKKKQLFFYFWLNNWHCQYIQCLPNQKETPKRSFFFQEKFLNSCKDVEKLGNRKKRQTEYCQRKYRRKK